MAKILVVEDNSDNRILIGDVLRSLDHEVIEANDGVEGVQKAKEHLPALILMDLSLPHKDGWQATREIKSDPKMNNIPIIALTAHAMVGDKERAMEAGCDDYITKPLDMVHLIKVLKARLE